MQEWLDTAREQPSAALTQAERDGLLARARDVIEHIQRVVHHVRRMEQGAESAVQIHFAAQSHRTNEIMRTLTAVTAVFLPLNLITGFFGMNFEYLPLIHSEHGMWVMLSMMGWVAMFVLLVFWRKRYLARTGR
jgi:Mg2+ and Co2+ transporter CorA